MPFDTQQFLEIFARYNEAVFPLQVFLFVMALVAIRLAGVGGTSQSKAVALMLAILWLWMGAVYHCVFFTEINTVAFAFGGFFIFQGLVFFYTGFVRSDLSFGRRSDTRELIGTLIIVYALLIYPLIGIASGHQYPYAPTFGLPCPTTIFTFGLLVRSGLSVPLYILSVPFAWSLLGISAAYSFGMREDIGLPIVALIASVLLVTSRKSEPFSRIESEN